MTAVNDWFKPVAATALACFDGVMETLGLSGGKNSGREYLPLNPKRDDHSPGSFSINRDKGAWMEGATGDQGGDLISLAAYVWSCSNGDAAERLSKLLGIAIPERAHRGARPSNEAWHATEETSRDKPAREPRKPRAVTDDGLCIMPVPADAPAAPALHPKHGKPAARWSYVDQTGALMFFHCRFEPDGERKQFAPLSLWRMAGGRMVWRWKAPTGPRPLLGLDRLAAMPDAVAVVCEGEKARDAAAQLLPDAVAMAWQGGGNAVDKADWLPLAGRVVWLWPDNDQAGDKAMSKAAERLQAIGATAVHRLNLEAFAKTAVETDGTPALMPGEPMADGDDAADLTARGWTAPHMALLIDTGEILTAAKSNTPASIPAPDDLPTEPPKIEAGKNTDHSPRSGFRLDNRGVWFVDVKNGEPAPPRWICSPLDILAQVRDEHSAGWGLLVGFEDSAGKHHREIIPARTFNGQGLEASGLLLDRGLKVAPSQQRMLLAYLQTAKPKTLARVTNRTGWHDSAGGSAFVLPDLSFGDGDEEWIFENDKTEGNTYCQQGNLSDWKTYVARRCVGNSRLAFAVCTAFASSLLRLIGAESGGFHFRSNSSDGKTVALRVAASVCGNKRFMNHWRTTDNGLEGLAQQYCDAPLLLDELAQLEAKHAGDAAYMLANGSGKVRAGRSGDIRPRSSWRLIFLSSGEIGLAQHMAEAGKQSRAGQELRLAEIPADAGKGLGLFENLHDSSSGADFAKSLESATKEYYGTAWIDWLKRLVAEPQEEIAHAVKVGMRTFESHFLTDKASGQVRRVAGRFALVGVAGELATQWGITGWPEGESLKSAGACLNAWLAHRGGEGNHEEQAMLRQIREFLSRYGESAFTDWERPSMTDTHAPVRSDRAGWRKHDSATDKVHYYVSYEAWRSRLCKGNDPLAMARLLLARGFVEKGTESNRPWLVKASVPGEGRPRVLHILPDIMENDDD